MYSNTKLDEPSTSSGDSLFNQSTNENQKQQNDQTNESKLCVFSNSNVDIFLNVYKFSEFLVKDLWGSYSLKSKLLNKKKLKYKDQSIFYVEQNEKKLILTPEILYKIQQQSNCSNTNFILGIIYLDRVIKSCKLDPERISIIKLFIISICLSIKIMEDKPGNYLGLIEKVIKVTKKQYLQMELEFLQIVDFKLFISENEYNQFLEIIKNYFHYQIQQNYNLLLTESLFKKVPNRSNQFRNLEELLLNEKLGNNTNHRSHQRLCTQNSV